MKARSADRLENERVKRRELWPDVGALFAAAKGLRRIDRATLATASALSGERLEAAIFWAVNWRLLDPSFDNTTYVRSMYPWAGVPVGGGPPEPEEEIRLLDVRPLPLKLRAVLMSGHRWGLITVSISSQRASAVWNVYGEAFDTAFNDCLKHGLIQGDQVTEKGYAALAADQY